jgi:hypothetical protein
MGPVEPGVCVESRSHEVASTGAIREPQSPSSPDFPQQAWNLALALQRTAGNRATGALLARASIQRLRNTKTGAQTRPGELAGKSLEELLALFEQAQAGELVDEAKEDEAAELPQLTMKLVLKGLERAATYSKTFNPDNRFGKAVKSLEELSEKLGKGPGLRTLDAPEATQLAKDARVVIEDTQVKAPKPAPPAAAGSILDILGGGVAPAAPRPIMKEEPKRGRRLEPRMSPESVESAIRGYSDGMLDQEGASIVRVWLPHEAAASGRKAKKNMPALHHYVSSWDRPASSGGKGKRWGFSSAHILNKTATWVIHVHRDEKGNAIVGNVQLTTFEGALGAPKEALTPKQLGRIGVPLAEPVSTYVKNEWTHWKKPDK